jgi:hypothetical protein
MINQLVIIDNNYQQSRNTEYWPKFQKFPAQSEISTNAELVQLTASPTSNQIENSPCCCEKACMAATEKAGMEPGFSSILP